MVRSRKFRLALLALVAILATSVPAFAGAKNVFMMISDGASFGAWDMADLYKNGSTASSAYYGKDFNKYLMTTFPLNTKSAPTGGNVPEVTYEANKAWDSSPNSGQVSDKYKNFFNAYEYLRKNYTDSAAAATALATGQKTYNNAINWSNDPKDTGSIIMPTIPELAKQCGKAVGTITSVQWTHATPAGFSDAHDITRNNYLGIAKDMLQGKVMDVIMGAGNPQYNDNGIRQIANYNDQLITDSKARYVGGRDAWIALNEGTHSEGWKLIQTKPAFDALAKDGLPQGTDAATVRLVGTAEVASTLQQSRSGASPTDKVNEDPLNNNVPTLVTMTKGAINVLDAKSKATGDKGFFLHIEGGAVDWAAHANQSARIIEEQIDFNNTVDAVINWIETKGGGWDNNLLVITTDHGNSMPLGPNSDTVFMDRIEVADVSGVPTVKWHYDSHTNELVPLFARGAGADLFEEKVDGTDNFFAKYYGDWALTGFDGRYVDNTDVYLALKGQVCPTPIPGSVVLMITGVVGMIVVGRRRIRS